MAQASPLSLNSTVPPYPGGTYHDSLVRPPSFDVLALDMAHLSRIGSNGAVNLKILSVVLLGDRHQLNTLVLIPAPGLSQYMSSALVK